MAKNNEFKTGAVLCDVLKDVPYMKGGKPLEELKGNPQFKKGKRVKLHYSNAGALHKAGYVAILNENKERIDTKKVANEK